MSEAEYWGSYVLRSKAFVEAYLAVNTGYQGCVPHGGLARGLRHRHHLPTILTVLPYQDQVPSVVQQPIYYQSTVDLSGHFDSG